MSSSRKIAESRGWPYDRIVPSATTELARLVQSLQKERQEHVDAITAIDDAFASLGISPKPAGKRGRPAAAKAAPKPGRKRRRREAKDGMTGEQFLLSLLAKAKLSTADVNAKWKASGRKNVANILLGQLVKKGKLKRADNRGGRGSVSSAA
mgnify:CR=1 FL=1